MWSNELTPGHTGYLVGLVPRSHLTPSLTEDHWHALTLGDDAGVTLRALQVGCSCGWRSSRIDAPIGTWWWQGAVQVTEYHEAEYRTIWRAHAIATVYAKEEAAKRG